MPSYRPAPCRSLPAVSYAHSKTFAASFVKKSQISQNILKIFFPKYMFCFRSGTPHSGGNPFRYKNAIVKRNAREKFFFENGIFAENSSGTPVSGYPRK